MAVAITIDSADVLAYVRRGSLRIQKDDAVETLSLVTQDNDLTASAYRPSLGDVVQVTQDSALLFGGTIEEVHDRASDGLNKGATEVTVRAVGYHLLPAQVLVTASYAAGEGTLDVFDDLVAVLPGVSNVGATTGGPTLPEIAWDHVPVSEALAQLQTLSGYVWRINGALGAAMAAAGATAGPTFTAANAKVIRQFGWSQSRLTRATRVWVKLGTAGTGATAYTQTWTGDGSRENFYLDVDPDAAPTTVYEDGSPVAVPSATWTYETARRRLVRATALGDEVVLTTTVTCTYPIWCRAENEASVDAGTLIEQVYAYPDVLEVTQGIALADGHLTAQGTAGQKRVVLQTREVNVYPWLQCTLTFTDRGISGDYLVRRVTIADSLGVKNTGTQGLLYEVELWEGSAASWVDWWKTAVRGVAGSGSVVTTGSGVSVINITGVLEGDLGGSRLNGVVHSTWAPVREHREWVCPADGTYTAHVEAWTSAAGTSCTPRVYDLTSAAAAATGSATTSTTAVKSQLVFSAVAGRSYRLEVLPGNTSADVFGLGKVRS